MGSYNIGKYKDMLSNHSFILTHKSHLVNKNHVREYNNSGFVILSNGENVPVSKNQRKIFISKFRDI